MILREKNGTHRRSIPSKKCVEGNQHKERILVLVGVKMCKGNLKDQVKFWEAFFYFQGFEKDWRNFTTMLFQQVWPILVLTKSTHLISQFFNQKKSSWYHVGWVTHAIPVIHLDRRNPNLSADSRHLDQKKGALLLGGSWDASGYVLSR